MLLKATIFKYYEKNMYLTEERKKKDKICKNLKLSWNQSLKSNRYENRWNVDKTLFFRVKKLV